VEARSEGAHIYPRRDLLTLSKSIPALSANFPSHDKFARATLTQVFGQERLEQAAELQVNTPESGVLVNEGQFRFRFEPLPELAQLAPSTGVDVADLNGDGHLDIVLAQNLYSPQPVAGRLDGGVSVLLLGKGDGTFTPVWPSTSGVIIPGEARDVRALELDGDGRPDLVFAVQGGRWRAFRNQAKPVAAASAGATTQQSAGRAAQPTAP
jgi:hypothetical protein